MADEYRIRLSADNEITDEAEEAAKAIEAIPEETRVRFRGDTDEVTRDIDDVLAKVERLSGTDAAELTLSSNAVRIGQEIADLTIEVDELDASDPSIDIKVDNIRDLEAGLDRLSEKAKEITGQPIELNTKPGAAGIRDIDDAARGANSALANMIGNSAQDLGALGGLAGSAGVAIGQVAEYASDAAIGGQKLSSVLGSMAKVVGPVAALGIGMAILKQRLDRVAETKAFNRERVDGFVEALDDAKVTAGELREVLEGDDGPGIFVRMGDDTVNVDRAVQQLFGTFEQFNAQVGRGAAGYDAWAAAQLAAAEAAGLSESNLKALKVAFDDAADGTLNAGSVAIGYTTKQRDLIGAATALGAATSGQAQATRDAAFEQQFYGEAAEDSADATQNAADAAAEQRARVLELADALNEWATKTRLAGGELRELDSVFSQIGFREGALSALFDLGNAPLTAAGQVRDIAIAIDGLSEAAADATLEPLLDELDGLRPQIQGKIVEAFSAGGPEAATAMANSYIDQVTAELGGKLSRDDVARLLGLENIAATVQVALDLSAVEEAKRQLDILTGLSGETAYTASIKLALDAGTITGAEAQALIQAKLVDAGVEIPGSLAVDTSSASTAVNDFIQAVRPEATVPLGANLDAAERDVDGFLDARREAEPVTVSADFTDADRDVEGFRTRRRETAPIVASANTSFADAFLNGFVNRPRTAVVDIETGTIDVPTAAQIVRRIGPVRVPIDLVVGQSIRITGIRD